MPWTSVARSRRCCARMERSKGIHDEQGEEAAYELRLLLALSSGARPKHERAMLRVRIHSELPLRGAQNMKININIGGKILTATWPTTRRRGILFPFSL